MALKSQITIDQLNILEVDADPSVGGQGVFAPVGSLALIDGLAGLWLKSNTNDTDWIKIANETILSNIAHAPYLTSTATTASGTLTLVKTSNSIQFFTGTAAGYSLVLPDATTLTNGWKYEFYNQSSQSITVKTNGGATLFTLAAGSNGFINLQSNSSSAGTWIFWQVSASTALTSASPGFTWGASGNLNSGSYLLNDTVPSNVAGRMVPLTSGYIAQAFVAVENSTTASFVIQKRSGASFVDLTTITLTAARVGTFNLGTSITVSLNDEIAVKVSSGSCKNPVLGLVIKGNA